MPVLTEKAWPRCPRCGEKADEVREIEDTVTKHVAVIAHCKRCGVEEHLEVPVGYEIKATMFGLQVVKNGQNPLPPRPSPLPPPPPPPVKEESEEKRFTLLEVD